MFRVGPVTDKVLFYLILQINVFGFFLILLNKILAFQFMTKHALPSKYFEPLAAYIAQTQVKFDYLRHCCIFIIHAIFVFNFNSYIIL